MASRSASRTSARPKIDWRIAAVAGRVPVAGLRRGGGRVRRHDSGPGAWHRRYGSIGTVIAVPTRTSPSLTISCAS